jgi:8-oxo-dGTP diphosphatase
MTTVFIDPDTWYAQLPGVVLGAGALITDPGGRVLVVKPNYRDYWTLPGGVCEHGEPPHMACAREVVEEIGLDVPIGALLAIEWSQPHGAAARPIMHFVFDGGILQDGAGIVLQEEELDDFRFAEPEGLADLLASHGMARVMAAIEGRAMGTTAYQPGRSSGAST